MAAPDPPIDEREPALPLPNAQPKWARPRFSFTLCQTCSPRVITAILFIIIFVIAFGGGLMGMPGLRLYEDIICHHYYNDLEGDDHIGFDGHIDEELCKGDEVQNQMNILLGVLAFLTPIPSTFLFDKKALNGADFCLDRLIDNYSLWAPC
jgi:hypothetical protein